MEPIPTPKRRAGRPGKNLLDAVVNALLAESDLRPRKSRRKTSKSSLKKCKGSEKPTKPEPQPESELEARITALFDDCATNADERLREFIRGDRCLVEKNGEEHFYNRHENRTYTLEEVGNVMGVTRERVRQIEEAALRKMWRLIRGMNMREDLTERDWIKGISEPGSDDPTVYYSETV